jgi:hypothetical protein
MKKAMTLMVFLLIILHASYAQGDRDKVWDLVVSLDNALVEKDSIKLGTLLTEDFIGAVPTGQSYKREAYIKFHCRPHVGLASIKEKPDGASIRIYGNTAIVNRRVEVVRVGPDGSGKELSVQRIEVCVLLNGKWYVASGQGTEVAAQ